MYIDLNICIYAGNVYATDAILALLMASPRSVYSWDITIEKTNGIIFLDKRENSLFDFLTVSETAREPPQVYMYIHIYIYI
jgi:translation initiation factor 3 subunit D